MSTQLILYPQNYSGYSFSSSMYVQQYVSNADFTSTMAGSIQNAVYNSAGFANFMASAPPIQAWQGFHSNSGTGWFNNTSAPTISTGTLTLNGTGGVASSVGSICGVYQTITGLTVGQSYDLVIDHPTGSGLNTGYFYLGIYGTHTYNQVNFIGQTPNVPVGSAPTQITNSGTSTTHTFVANDSTMQLSFAWLSDFNTGVLNITKISIEETGVTPVQVFNDLFDGQVICDLYQEQDIPLTLSVDNFTNIAEKTQSYSKDFDLPATKRNNKIFTHIFEVTKTISDVYDFNPYISTKAALKQNGVLLFEGSLRLIEIVDKNGEISYNVNLFADSIALADVLATRTFSDLQQVMSELDHEYTNVNISNSTAGYITLESPLPTGTFAGTPGASTTTVLRYPFVDWTGTIDCTNATAEVNHKSNVFRPWIKLKYLIDNIFFQAGFSYTSAFFNSSEFNNMYMDFNWGNGNAPQVAPYGQTFGTTLLDSTQYATTSFANCVSLGANLLFQPPGDFDSGTNQYVSSVNNNNMVLTFSILLKNEDTSSRTAEIQIVDKGVVVATSGTQTIAAGGTYLGFDSNTIGNLTTTLNSGDILAIQFKSDVAGKVRLYSPNFPSQASIATYSGTQSTLPITSSAVLNSLRGELNQWEFLRSIMTMFNLVTMPDPENPNNILIEPYNDVFGEDASAVTPTERDWTYKLDITDINLKPLDLKRKTVFRYEEDEDDYAFGVYKKAASGFLYGSKTFDQTSYNLIEGEEEIVAESFAATICKPLQDNYYDFYVPVIYSGDIEKGFESFENIPRILINTGQRTQTFDVGSTTWNYYLGFSHTSALPSTVSDIDINFGNCALFTGASPTDNLYNTYYAGYYEHLYNPNTRIMTAKVNLNPTDINTFKFFDVVTIKNRQYRVNKIDYKPNALSTVEFILLN